MQKIISKKKKPILNLIFFLNLFNRIRFNLILALFVSFYYIGCSTTNQLNIISRSEWNANNPKLFKAHFPVRITIHHEGEIFDPLKEKSNAHIKKIQTWGMSEARYWSDIPYHFLIDFDGNIFEGRNVFTAGETATEYNPEGHLLITCLGNFEVQEVTDAQLNALITLIVHCCIKYQISPETIKAHKDYANTLCPGKNLYKFLENGYILEKVKIILNSKN